MTDEEKIKLVATIAKDFYLATLDDAIISYDVCVYDAANLVDAVIKKLKEKGMIKND